MRVEFLQDFRGKLTREQFYLKGQQLDVDDVTGAELVAKGYAVAVSDTPALDKLVAQNDSLVADEPVIEEALEETAWGEDVVEGDDEAPAEKPPKRGRR